MREILLRATMLLVSTAAFLQRPSRGLGLNQKKSHSTFGFRSCSVRFAETTENDGSGKYQEKQCTDVPHLSAGSHNVNETLSQEKQKLSSSKRRKKPIVYPPPPTPSEFPDWAFKPRDFFSYELLHQSTKSRARVGRITTPHGIIDTYVPGTLLSNNLSLSRLIVIVFFGALPDLGLLPLQQTEQLRVWTFAMLMPVDSS